MLRKFIGLWVFISIIFSVFLKFRFELSLTRDRLLTSAPAEAMSKWIIASLNPARQRASSSSGVRESELELEGSWVRSSPGAHKKMSHSPRCYLLVIHLLIYFCFTFISHSIIIPSNFISRNWTEERSATPGGYSSKFYVLYGQAPITYPFTYDFWQKSHTFRIPTI